MKERRCRAVGLCKDQKGFTLIELILTIAILAVVTIPILSYFTDAAKHNARSRQKQNASVVAQDVLEEFKNTKYSLDDPDVVCSAQPDWTKGTAPDAEGVYTLTQDRVMDKNSFKVTAKIKPLKAVASTPTSTALPKNYEKYVIGTMDSSKDIMASEHGQTYTAAALAYANLNAAACAESGANPMTMDDIKSHLDCTIVISAKKDSDTTGKPDNDIITVTYRYTYNNGGSATWPAGITASTKPYEDVVESASINVKKLENIYLFYQPINARDTILLETDDENRIELNANDLNLFVIAQNSIPSSANDTAGYTKRPSGYQLHIADNVSGFKTKVANLYLNLSVKDNELDTAGTIAQKARKDPSGEYTLVHSEEINRIADITVTVDSTDGKNIVTVNGSKTQN